MHRQFSLQPFSRHYSHSTNPFLDFLEIHNGNDLPQITVAPEKRKHLLQVLTAYKSVQAAGVLHTLTFVTVNDYLWLLRAVSHELSALGKNAMYYLAAAVSDFFLPRQKMVSVNKMTAFDRPLMAPSRNTRFNREKVTLASRWTRCPRFLNPWWMSGQRTGLSFLSRCVLPTHFDLDLCLKEKKN